MKQKKKRTIDIQFITACISTSLVLLLLGSVVMVVLTAGRLSDHVRENLELSLLLNDDAKTEDVNRYQADLSGRTEGSLNYSEASRLDADLIGKVSSILLIDNPEGFRENTVVPTEPELLCESLPFFDGISLPKGMVFTVRADCDAGAVYQQVSADR